MKNLWTALRTNEDGARTKTIIATAITITAIGVGIYVTKKNAPVPVLLVTTEAVENLTEAVQP